MWLSPETTSQFAASAREAQARLDAERLIDASGRGVCKFCGEEILKNPLALSGGGWEWETERLIGYCDQDGNGKRHKPRLTWTPDEGIVNV